MRSLKSNVFLSTDRIDGLELNFIPSRVYVPPYGTTSSLLHIKASQTADVRAYTLPIYANILFPTEGMLRDGSNTVNNSVLGSISENLALPIDVLKSLTFEEKLSNFYNSWFTPIAGMYAAILGIIAGISPWIVAKYKRMKKDKDMKSAREK